MTSSNNEREQLRDELTNIKLFLGMTGPSDVGDVDDAIVALYHDYETWKARAEAAERKLAQEPDEALELAAGELLTKIGPLRGCLCAVRAIPCGACKEALAVIAGALRAAREGR